MAVSLASIRSALQTRLATLPSTVVYTDMPTNYEAPTGGAAIAIEPEVLSEYVSFSGQRDWTFKAHVLVRAAGKDRGQTTLDLYKSPTGSQSIEACLDADPRLGSTVDCAFVSGWQDYGGLIEQGSGQGLLHGTVSITVWA